MVAKKSQSPAPAAPEAPAAPAPPPGTVMAPSPTANTKDADPGDVTSRPAPEPVQGAKEPVAEEEKVVTGHVSAVGPYPVTHPWTRQRFTRDSAVKVTLDKWIRAQAEQRTLKIE